jgi:catechol 2,3-dioxygenase-like lactoylglutathione lyase family enzyme
MTTTQVEIEHLDHLVIVVADTQATMAFYERVLGMRRVEYGEGRLALAFGAQKINVKPYSAALAKAPLESAHPTRGSADLCFITKTPVDALIAHLKACDVAVEAGPVERSGARARLHSVYFRDPDGNLIEISNELERATHLPS